MKQLGMRINKVIWEILLPGIAIFLAIVFFILAADSALEA